MSIIRIALFIRDTHNANVCGVLFAPQMYFVLSEREINMSRCPNLKLAHMMNGIFNNPIYFCSLSEQKIESYDPKVKYVCDAEYGEEYKQCPIYQDKAKNFRE